ncbi:poly(3-hydroxybutyrate) depolymerase-like [Asterias amurensis]|uniref:poly(3-hydroxybutyrate) depolymerase-like n=1 Tax=Asterias amurensis TaxID=7602 RepID=UPI003AB4A44B
MAWREAAISVLVVLVYAVQTGAWDALDNYGADPTKVSVSGVSSGANMAVQLHVAYSSSIMGVGAVAGGPYYCAQGSSYKALYGECSTIGNGNNIDVQDLIDDTDAYAANGKVDATSNMASARVYIFSGTEDTIVPTVVVKKLEDYYDHYVNSSYIMTKYDLPAGHGFITTDYTNDCDNNLASPNINDCNYNMAFEILNHIYGGNLVDPGSGTTLNGELLWFDQKPFFPYLWKINPFYMGMAYTGRIYVPSGCSSSNSGCKLHVALHGCGQSTYSVNDQYYTHTGYNEVGELNNIIILYPQGFPNAWYSNPLGCWDWWGYTTSNYATNEGREMDTIKQMIDRILQ